MRARSIASSGSLASSSPVEAQLFIQTRAISSYSSGRAGRMVGGATEYAPGMTGKRKSPRDTIARAFSTSTEPGKILRRPRTPRSGEVVAVQVHHLGPRRHEVFHKLLLRVRARIDFRQRAQQRVRTEDQVDTGPGPLDLVRLPVAP